jgi:uncharacterized protein YjbI with pentapeptide repeats
MDSAQWLRWAILALVIVAFLWFVPQLQGEYFSPKVPDQERPALVNEYRRTWAQIIGGFGLLLGLYFTWRRIEISQQELEATRDQQVTERFTRAIDQLGATDEANNKKLEIRLGGIYALERIAGDSLAMDDSPGRDYSTVMEVLTAYVRENTTQAPGPSEGSSEAAAPSNEATAAADEGTKQPPPLEPRRPTADIQAILDVLSRTQADVAEEHRTRLDLHEADLQGADLIRANLQGSSLRGAILQRAHFQRANLQEANLRGADLRGARLQEARLQRANLQEANLQGANLQEVNLHRADLYEAILRDANLQEANLHGEDLQGANFQGANLQEANLQEANLQEANLQGAILQQAILRGAILFRADLRGTHLQQAILQQAHLFRADLRGAILQRANLQDAKVTDSQLANTRSLQGATMPNGQKYEDWLKDREGHGKDGENSDSS